MGWCSDFKKYKLKGWIDNINGKWYIVNNDYLMEIRMCPFCGATLRTDDF